MKTVKLVESTTDDVQVLILCGPGKTASVGFCNDQNIQSKVVYDDTDGSTSIWHDAPSTNFPALKVRKNGVVNIAVVNSFSSEQAAKTDGLLIAGDLWQLNGDGIPRVIR